MRFNDLNTNQKNQLIEDWTEKIGNKADDEEIKNLIYPSVNEIVDFIEELDWDYELKDTYVCSSNLYKLSEINRHGISFNEDGSVELIVYPPFEEEY